MARQLGNYDQALQDAVVETFEKLAFLQPVVSEERKEIEQDCLCFVIAVEAPLFGYLKLVMPEKLIRILVKIIWSLDDEAISDQLLLDTTAELLNTIVGRFVCGLVADNETFKVGLPERCDLNTGNNKELVSWGFELEDSFFQIFLWGDDFS